MWSLRKRSIRRLDLRRPGAEAVGLLRRFWRGGGPGSMAIATALLAGVLLLDLAPLHPLPYRLGQHLSQEVYARVTFGMPSPQKTAEARAAAARRVPAILRPEKEALQRIVGELQNLPGRLKATSRPEGLDKALAERFAIAPGDMEKLSALADARKAEAYNQQVERLARELTRQFIVSDQDYQDITAAKDVQQVQIADGDKWELNSKAKLLSLRGAGLEAFLAEAAAGIEPAIRPHVVHFLNRTFAEKRPLFVLDKGATDAAAQAARAAVDVVHDIFPAGQAVAARTGPEGLAQVEMERLAAEHEAYWRQQAAQPWAAAKLVTGRAGLIAAIIVLLCLYVRKYRPMVARRHGRAALTAGLLLLMLLAAKAVSVLKVNPYLAIFGVFFAAVALTIAYDQRFAFAVSGVLAVLTAMQMRLGPGPLLALWAAGAAVVFQLREVRTRSKLILTGLLSAAVALSVVVAAALAEGTPTGFALRDALFAAAAVLGGGFLAQGLLPVIERLFGVATSLTLLEWCDANKPLLKRLALEAPGTYSHSLMLGSMCEAAAEAVAARGLLARVGAYYHDVGKINKPDYFVENQLGPNSRHQRLSPAMSLLVIKGHVKDGLELARDYGLPNELHEFVATHHGTTLVEYFFYAATRQRRLEQRVPEEVEFRYIGPKPHSREAAILMLADAAESSVRAMGEPSAGRIETQVHLIVSKRLTDGQLDDCELTLREVHAIETSLTKSLVGMYHGRVLYPTQAPPNGAAAPPNGAERQAERPVAP